MEPNVFKGSYFFELYRKLFAKVRFVFEGV